MTKYDLIIYQGNLDTKFGIIRNPNVELYCQDNIMAMKERQL